MNDLFDKENIFLVVGATNNTQKYGSKVFLDLKDAGYNVIAINKNGGEVHETPAYESVTAFLERVKTLFNDEKHAHALEHTILVLVVPPEASLTVVKEGLEHGIKRAWFQPGSEDDAVLDYCEEHGIEATHDQCIMVDRPRSE